MSRKKEREYALKGVFQLDFHPEPGDFTESIAYFLEDNELDLTYGKTLIDTTEAHLPEIDDILDDYLKSTWKIDRIPKVEKSILRLAICELKYMDENMLVMDRNERPVVLFVGNWQMNWTIEQNPQAKFLVVPPREWL